MPYTAHETAMRPIRGSMRGAAASRSESSHSAPVSSATARPTAASGQPEPPTSHHSQHAPTAETQHGEQARHRQADGARVAAQLAGEGQQHAREQRLA